MAMQLGLENKKQVRTLAILLALLLPLGGYVVYTNFLATPVPSTPAPVAAPAAVHQPAAQKPVNDPQAQKLTNAGIDPTLHVEKLAASEAVAYSGGGRNIFSSDTAPVTRMEQPVKSPRANSPALPMRAGPPMPPPAPKPPEIALKYFGYTVRADKSYQAFFSHGDDIFMARTGEIINHRYKVGLIRASSVEVTDLSYNNKQVLPLMGN